MLRLSDKPFIAKGKRQFVYDHPENPDALIKIPQPDTYDAEGHMPDATRIERKFRRATMYKNFLREFHEYIELKARLQEPGILLPICEVHGTVPTDLGLGLVYQRIADPDGSLSPSLLDLIEKGHLEDWHLLLLEDYFDALVEQHVVISNKNLANIVLQTLGPRNARFVWIDSFGSKRVVPLRKWSQRVNAWRLGLIRREIFARIDQALTRTS